MVEISESESPFFNDEIPMVHASIVSMDADLAEIQAEQVMVDDGDSRWQQLGGDMSHGRVGSPSVTRNGLVVGSTDDDISTATLVTLQCGVSISSGSSSSFSYQNQTREQTSAQSTDSSTQNVALPQQSALQPESEPSFSDSHTTTNRNQLEHVTLAAGAAGAVLGLLTGGPFLSIVLGVVSAHYCTQEGMAGDVARALGEVAITAQHRFQEVDQKHHMVDRSKKAATNAFARAKKHLHSLQDEDKKDQFRAFLELDAKHKCTAVVIWCWKSLVDFERKHNLIQRGSIQAKKAFDELLEKVSSSTSATLSEGQGVHQRQCHPPQQVEGEASGGSTNPS